MENTNSTIQINGKHYDASTGKPVGGSTHAEPASHNMEKPEHHTHQSEHNAAKRPANHAAPHAQTRSQILMRKAVDKPGPSLKRQVHAQGHLTPAPPAQISGSDGLEKRLQRANHVPKSKLITHFSDVKGAAPRAPSQPAVSQARAGVMDVLGSAPQPARPRTTNDVLEHGLRQARSHEQKPLKRQHTNLKRQLSVVAVVTLAVGVLTVVAANNLNGAQLSVASAKAGFSARLPDFKPAGFSQSAVNSSKGTVATQFQSSTDARNYTITQKASEWDSTELRDNFVASQDPNYQTIATNGNVIYIYGNHNATWINGGIWYNVAANGALSDRQLVELATSL
ncbi:MAG TPA: hypothetical protein VLG27_02410 [Candidatus Saccharimonadia bacterium]|nr:hypothetical protein [Candidatus Saccharimonadia bacterium]